MLGICTRYTQSSPTYFALRLADWADEHGHEAALYSTTESPVWLDSPWDEVVVRPQFGVRFTDWARTCKAIIWTDVPPVGQLTWARSRGIKTAVLCSWHCLVPDDRASLREADVIYVPSREVARYLQSRWQLTNTSALPWDNGLPFTRKDMRLRTKHRYIYLPLFDDIPERSENTVVDLAVRLLNFFDDTVLTVGYNSSTLGTVGSRRLRKYAKSFPERLRLVPHVPPALRCLYNREHDLTLYPVHADDWGMTLVDSMTMGTPVAAFNFPPLSEMMLATNALVVPCDCRVDQAGLPQPVTDFQRMEKSLLSLLMQDGELDSLQETVLHGLQQRRTAFGEVLTRLLK